MWPKKGQGVHFFKKLILQATATNRMHNNDLEACEKCCYFWFHSVVKTSVWTFIILPYFNAISIDFYEVKCLINIYLG